MYRKIVSMMTINYPTLKIVENYLNNYFNRPISLSSCISTMGYNVGGGSMSLLGGANIPNEPITGIDIPILINDSNATKANYGTIMILEQDPLRRLSEFQKIYNTSQLQNNAIVGTPNAFHTNPVGFYKELVDNMITDGWSVYLTDTYKIWAPGLKGGKNRWTDNEKDLLCEEMSCIKPTIVLLCGKEAKKAYDKIQCTSKVKIVGVPHPSGMANRAWVKILDTKPTDANKRDFILKMIRNIKP